MPQPSPYTPGQVAHQVPGRDEQLADYRERLDFMAATQSLVPVIRVDQGPRGLGKTSMMRAAERLAAQQFQALTVWVVAGEQRSLLSSIAVAAERAIARQVSGKEASSRARLSERTTLKFGLSVPGIGSAEATVAPRPKAAQEQPVDARDVEDLLDEVHQEARGKRPGGVVIFVDEIQEADPASLRTLSYAWQNLQAERPDLPVALFTAGLPTSAAVINDAVTNAERFDYRTLGGLDPSASAVALAGPAHQLGVQWDQDALQEAVQRAEGYPHTLQLIGKHTWNAAGRPDPGGTITRQHLEAGQQKVDADMRQMFRNRLDRARTPQQREFVQAMAELGDGAIARAAIAERLGKPSTSLSYVRDQLLTSGVITEAGYGSVTFGLPGFAEYIRTERDAEPPAEGQRALPRSEAWRGAAQQHFGRTDGRGNADGATPPARREPGNSGPSRTTGPSL